MPTMASLLPDDPGTLKAMLIAERALAKRLEEIIKAMQHHRFGRRAETLSEDQLLLGLEDVEQTVAATEAFQEFKAPVTNARPSRASVKPIAVPCTSSAAH
jgi:transposase